MRRIFLLLAVSLLSFSVSAQVFHSGRTLGGGNFAVGILPAVHTAGSPSDGLNLYLFAGYGLKPGIDLNLNIGVGSSTYFGADLEWDLGKYLSFTTGIHQFGDIGLDGALNFAFPIRSDARLFSGIDMDLVFANELRAPFWIPVGIELGIRKNISFVLEGEIGLNPEAYHILALGLDIYF